MDIDEAPQSDVGYCDDCGWEHADLPGCWRKVTREAREKLADPTFTGPMRDQLQAAYDKSEAYRLETIAFFQAAMADGPADDW